jgi:predicted SnoaL-like aldol condensation-catalyzing enzyme
MESSSVKNLGIAKSWLRSFNEHNLENLLALYDEQAIHFSPKLKVHRPDTNGLIKGKAALHDWWEDSFQRLPELQYREVSLTADEHRVFMEYTRIVPGEPEMNVAEVLEIENGFIVRSRVYHG